MSDYSTYYKILTNIETENSYKCLENYANYLSQQDINELIIFIGNYSLRFTTSISDLEIIENIIGPITIEYINFAIMLFDYDIINNNYRFINEKLGHSIFNEINEELRNNIIQKIIIAGVSYSNYIHFSELSLLFPNFENYGKLITRSNFIKFLKESFCDNNIEKNSIGYELVNKLKSECIVLIKKYKNPLFNLDIDDNDILIIKNLAFLLFTDAKNSEDLNDFMSISDRGGLLLISSIIFAKDTDKDKNTDFWGAYYNWLGLPENMTSNLNQKIYKDLKAFFNSYNIAYLVRSSKRIQYVLTLRMHSIVANRPLSRRKITHFLKSLVKLNGFNYHDKEYQQDVLYNYLNQLFLDYKLAKEDFPSLVVYSPLPLETLEAFSISQEQVVDYLQPLYDYIECSLINKLYPQNKRIKLKLPEYIKFLKNDIKEIILIESKTKNKKTSHFIKSRKITKACVSIDILTLEVKFNIPSLLIQRESKLLNDINSATIYYSIGNKTYQRQLEIEYLDSYIITEEISIPFNFIGEKLDYSIRVNDKENKGSITFNYIFDSNGNPLNMNNKIAQKIYCIAKNNQIIAENLLTKIYELDEVYSIYETYIDNDSFIILNNNVYSLSNKNIINSGFEYHNQNYSDVKLFDKGLYFQVLGSFPQLYFRVSNIKTVKQNIELSLNSKIVDFEIIQDFIILDGLGDYFVKIKVLSSIEDFIGKLVTIKLFDREKSKAILLQTFFILTNLHYNFSKDFYFYKSDIQLTNLNFDNKEQILARKYESFDNFHLSEFKVNLSNRIAKLLIPNKLICISLGDKNLLQRKDYWFSELLDKKQISIVADNEIKVFKLYTEDDENQLHQVLSKRGKVQFSLDCLGNPPINHKRSVKLKLEFYLNNMVHIKELCTIHYRVSLINFDNFITFWNTRNIRIKNRKFKLSIEPLFIYDPKEIYNVELINLKKEIIFSEELSANNLITYQQDGDLKEGAYSLVVSHTKGKSLFQSEEVIIDLKKDFYYQNKHYEYLFNLINVMDKVLLLNNKSRFEINNPIKPISFIFDTKLEVGKKVSAKLYIYNYRTRSKYFINNHPYNIQLVQISDDGYHIFKILDRDSEQLGIDPYIGYVYTKKDRNYKYSFKHQYFEGKLIKQRT